MTLLDATGIVVRFDGQAAVDGADLAVDEGEVVAVLGPSGCGKSTLLRVIAGLERPAAGRVLVAGEDVTSVPPHRRGVGLMVQRDTLFPHRDVGQNVGFGLRIGGRPRHEVDARVAELLELVGLRGLERRNVAGLSGGERQRVELARALAPEPRLLLLDEPLASLDRPLRERLLLDLERLFARLGRTVVYVTHDVGEAFALGHRVAVMRDGRMVQVARPDGLWAAPRDAWVARFLGLVNIVEHEHGATLIRPEAVVVGSSGRPGRVISAHRQGALVRIRILLDDGSSIEAATTSLRRPAAGDAVRVRVDPAGVVELPNSTPSIGEQP